MSWTRINSHCNKYIMNEVIKYVYIFFIFPIYINPTRLLDDLIWIIFIPNETTDQSTTLFIPIYQTNSIEPMFFSLHSIRSQFSLDIIATFLQLFTPFKILLSRLISQGRVMHNSSNRSPYRNFPANGFL